MNALDEPWRNGHPDHCRYFSCDWNQECKPGQKIIDRQNITVTSRDKSNTVSLVVNTVQYPIGLSGCRPAIAQFHGCLSCRSR